MSQQPKRVQATAGEKLWATRAIRSDISTCKRVGASESTQEEGTKLTKPTENELPNTVTHQAPANLGPKKPSLSRTFNV